MISAIVKKYGIEYVITKGKTVITIGRGTLNNNPDECDCKKFLNSFAINIILSMITFGIYVRRIKILRKHSMQVARVSWRIFLISYLRKRERD